MNAIDAVLIVLLFGVVALETKRGFGKAIFDFAALFIAIRAVPILAPAAAKSMHLAKDAPANQAIWFALLFLIVGGILLFLGKVAYQSTLVSLETLDPLFGGALGIAVAVIVGHCIVRALAISAGVNGTPPETLTTSAFGMEFYRFTSYHRVVDFLTSLAS
jgi:uncharacterized membrane protein required for colicin V production